MRERPILFSGPMVRAILDGSKTQTRRTVKPAPVALSVTREDGTTVDQGILHPSVSPYGEPGDRLWVRESHYRFGHWEPVPGVRTRGGRMKWRFVADADRVVFDEPDAPVRLGRHHKAPATPAWHKRLARFMPRALSRVALEVTDVRVERLHGISEEEARAEGVVLDVGCPCEGDAEVPGPHKALCRYSIDDWPGESPLGVEDEYRMGFAALWASINGAASWGANPWVWVVSFRRVAP